MINHDRTSWMQEGIEQGMARGERSFIRRLLNRQVGELPAALRSQIETLSIAQLEALGDAWLDFASVSDLETWLATHLPGSGR
ncbi:DUF4351 domain-containing protein [Trichothermofontia sp.]